MAVFDANVDFGERHFLQEKEICASEAVLNVALVVTKTPTARWRHRPWKLHVWPRVLHLATSSLLQSLVSLISYTMDGLSVSICPLSARYVMLVPMFRLCFVVILLAWEVWCKHNTKHSVWVVFCYFITWSDIKPTVINQRYHNVAGERRIRGRRGLCCSCCRTSWLQTVILKSAINNARNGAATVFTAGVVAHGTEPFRSRASSLPGANRPIGSWPRFLELSLLGPFASRPFRSQERTFYGTKNFHSLELSLP